ncbi:MAG: RnfABCDGE type electron transport complex subunit D [Spirochaetales bacterium]|nr:RnfABCDGE type electron transport complex subunit D [Spirochaetales bacterium]
MQEALHIRTAPHLHRPESTPVIMRRLCFSLLPVCVFSAYLFGVAAILLLLTALFFSLGTEWFFNRLQSKASTLGDYSAVVTAILFALTLPPGLPLWMAAVGSAVSIAAGKLVFGGLGQNPFNPSLVGRAFLLAAFPGAMTRWQEPQADFFAVPAATLTLPFLRPQYDGLTAATALASQKFEGQTADSWLLLSGQVSGSLGETSFALIAVCGSYLAFKGLSNWRIPASILMSVALCGFVSHQIDPVRYADFLFQLLSGGLALGAFFLATDPVTSPLTHKGMFVYGIFIGFVTFLIRSYGGLPEGVMYAILLGNACTPLINRFTENRVYGS